MPKIAKIILLASLLFVNAFYCNATSQTTKDSMLQILATSTDDSLKVEVLKTLAELGDFADREESINFYKQILSYEIDNTYRGEVLNRIGFFNWQLGNYEQAIKWYSLAQNIFSELQDSMFLGRIYNNIAVSHWGLGENIEALKNYQLSLNIRKALNDKKGVSNVLNNIGKIYQQLQLYDEAFKMHSEAIEYAIASEESAPVSYSYANLGDIYQNKNELDLALQNYLKGYKILLELDSLNRSNSFFSSRIGSVYTLQNKLDSALIYNKKALAYAIRINNKNRIAVAEYNLGKTFVTIGQPDSARFYINRSYQKAREKGYEVLIKDNLFVMAELEEADNNFTEAYKFYKRAAILNDSIYNKEVVSKVADLQVKYVSAQKERENMILRKNNEIQQSIISQQRLISGLFIALSILILIILYFIARSRYSIKKLNQKLEQSEKHLKVANTNKDRFFTIIAHDLRSPFNGILGITELLDNDFNRISHDHKKELIVMLRQSAVNYLSLLNSLLQWAQIQQNTIKYEFEEFEMHTIATKVWKILNVNAVNKNITLNNNIEPQLKVFADKNSVETILRNLVNNAIKFTHEGGKIEIVAMQTNKLITIEVKDNGVGISKKNCEKLFIINESITQPGTKDESGTGLGLVLCKELVEKNKGKIWVESSKGEGSSFFFSLPASEVV